MPPLQQPFGQVWVSHAQRPSVVSQSPFAQAAQAAPAAPQREADCVAASTHVVPLQQPNGQELASQTHCPMVLSPGVLSHSRPAVHVPYAAPPVPHDVLDSDAYRTHVPVGPPLQQPFGHEVESQTHCPVPLHSCPAGHAAHAAPPAPHEVLDSPLVGSSHVSLAVQHPGHDVPAHEQAPAEHEEPLRHALHAAPPVPHSAVDWEGPTSTQAPIALQQPPGHEVALQAHLPVVVSHVWSAAHAEQLAPPMPHSFAVSEVCDTH